MKTNVVTKNEFPKPGYRMEIVYKSPFREVQPKPIIVKFYQKPGKEVLPL